MKLEEFNRAPREEAIAVLRPCVDIARWCDDVVDARPFGSVDELAASAASAATPFTDDEIEAALAHHPRIGDRAEGASTEASLSRAEQAGLGDLDAVQRALRDGNLAYEERFGRVFLIRAAGRSADEILSSLQARLQHDDDTEQEIVAEQLRQIALLRLRGAIAS